MSICLFLPRLQHCDWKFNVTTYPILHSLSATVCCIRSAKPDLHTFSPTAPGHGGLTCFSVAQQPARFPSQHRLTLPRSIGVCTTFLLWHAALELLVSHLAPIKIWTVFSETWCALTSEKSKDYCCFSSNHQPLRKQARGPSGEKTESEGCLNSGDQGWTRAPQNSRAQRPAGKWQKVQQPAFWSIHSCLQGALGWAKLGFWERCRAILCPPYPISAFLKHGQRIFVHSSLPFKLTQSVSKSRSS